MFASFRASIGLMIKTWLLYFLLQITVIDVAIKQQSLNFLMDSNTLSYNLILLHVGVNPMSAVVHQTIFFNCLGFFSIYYISVKNTVEWKLYAWLHLQFIVLYVKFITKLTICFWFYLSQKSDNHCMHVDEPEVRFKFWITISRWF